MDTGIQKAPAAVHDGRLPFSGGFHAILPENARNGCYLYALKEATFPVQRLHRHAWWNTAGVRKKTLKLASYDALC
jgi:hypothetical protein